MTSRRTTGFVLLAAGALLLLLRSRARAEGAAGGATGPDPATVEAYRSIVSAFRPEAPTINERSSFDAATEALWTYHALYDRYGTPYRMEFKTAEGSATYTRDMSYVPPAFAQFAQRGGDYVGTKPIRIIEP
jgi:hypothetical protein